MPLLTVISEALSRADISVGQTVDNSGREDIIANTNSQPSSSALPGSDEKKEGIARIILPLLTIISGALGQAGMNVGQTVDNSGREDIIARLMVNRGHTC